MAGDAAGTLGVSFRLRLARQVRQSGWRSLRLLVAGFNLSQRQRREQENTEDADERYENPTAPRDSRFHRNSRSPACSMNSTPTESRAIISRGTAAIAENNAGAIASSQ